MTLLSTQNGRSNFEEPQEHDSFSFLCFSPAVRGSYQGVMDPDTLMLDSDADPTPDPRHFVVAIDFGTTFSSVAYVGYKHQNQRRRIGFQQLELVDRYPDHPYTNFDCHDVPTGLWYSQPMAKPIRHEESDFEHQSSTDDSDNDGSDSEVSSDGSEPEKLASAEPNRDNKRALLFWGYGVQEQLKKADHDADQSRHLSRFKLMLDESPHTANLRNTLSETCKNLKKMRLIEEDTDIIADYLEQLFKHTKERLTDSEGYTDASTVEFVLCIPAIWKSKASRQMQIAMATAINNSGLGRLQNGSVDNLFLVSEPEAAAACALASEKSRLEVQDYSKASTVSGHLHFTDSNRLAIPSSCWTQAAGLSTPSPTQWTKTSRCG
jgi:hypothetical protein